RRGTNEAVLLPAIAIGVVHKAIDELAVVLVGAGQAVEGVVGIGPAAVHAVARGEHVAIGSIAGHRQAVHRIVLASGERGTRGRSGKRRAGEMRGVVSVRGGERVIGGQPRRDGRRRVVLAVGVGSGVSKDRDRNGARLTRNEATGCTIPTAWELKMKIPLDMKKLFLLPVLFVLPVASYAQAGTYMTTFPSSENSISQGGKWINGQAAGLDWSNVRTMPGFAFGTQTGATAPPYNDSTAVLTGSWGATQFAQATVRAVSCTDSSYEEVELLLRTTITAHSITGYEF